MTKFSLNSIYPYLETITEPFKGILLDAYGVFWGGNATGVLRGCKETMERLVQQGKLVGILSNSTQLAKKETEKLQRHGLIANQHFHFFITSGELAKNIFTYQSFPFPTPNKRFYLFSPPHPKFASHRAIFEGTLFQETSLLQEADFIYIPVPHVNGQDQINSFYFKEAVEALISTQLPMVCTNPDLYAHEGNPPQAVLRQGSIALMYEKLGGQVFYIGKPSEKMYKAAMNCFIEHDIVDPQTILMVGDTPETDIRGARNFSMPSALVIKTGIMADRIASQGLKNAFSCLPSTDSPDFIIQYMGKNGI